MAEVIPTSYKIEYLDLVKKEGIIAIEQKVYFANKKAIHPKSLNTGLKPIVLKQAYNDLVKIIKDRLAFLTQHPIPVLDKDFDIIIEDIWYTSDCYNTITLHVKFRIV